MTVTTLFGIAALIFGPVCLWAGNTNYGASGLAIGTVRPVTDIKSDIEAIGKIAMLKGMAFTGVGMGLMFAAGVFLSGFITRLFH
jgi:hypothetical protein